MNVMFTVHIKRSITSIQLLAVTQLFFSCQLTHRSVPHHHTLDRLHCGAVSGHDIIKKSANIKLLELSQL